MSQCAGQKSLSIGVKLIPTTSAGRNATFSLRISSPTSATLGAITTTVATVIEYARAGHPAPVPVASKKRHHG